ncbi:MAG: hypothetical protein PUD96_02635 [Coriobacteriaceae bacterium]|nr:hypothetical protein [Coriobacteriaceae bacterium]MDD6769114.1 hypothetical protein [Coriobacteriaceae bacterium]
MAQAARRNSYGSVYATRGGVYGTSARQLSQEAPQQQPRERYTVIPGQNKSAERAVALSPVAIRGFKFALAALAALALICSVRVFLSVSTVQALEASASLQTQIEEARAAGNDLEIRHAVLSNPSSIQKKATRLGMSAPKTTERITVALPPSTQLNAAGSISVSATLKSVQNSALGSK